MEKEKIHLIVVLNDHTKEIRFIVVDFKTILFTIEGANC